MSPPEASAPPGAPARTSAFGDVLFLVGEKPSRVIILALASLLSGLTESAILAILAQAAAALVSGSHRVRVAVGGIRIDESITRLLLYALALAVVRLLAQALVSVLPAQIGADVQGRVRTQVFDDYTRASWTVQSEEREGQLQEILSNQLAQAASGAIAAAQLVTTGLTFLMLVIAAVFLNVAAAALVLVVAVALFGLLRPLSNLGRSSSAGLSLAWLDYGSAVSEAVRLSEETHAFGVGEAQRKHVGNSTRRVRTLFFRQQALAILPSAIFQSLIYLVVVGGLALLTTTHTGHVASLGAVVLVLVRAGTYGQQAQGAYQGVRQALPFVEKLQSVSKRYIASAPRAGRRRLDAIRSLTFHEVRYAYRPEHTVLREITFQIAHGEMIGIVGPSGVGKSTLVQLLLRLREPTTGRYLIDDTPADEVSWLDWHRQVAFVPQQPQLLHATVSDNISYFRDLDGAAVERAAQLAAIHEEVLSWPQGYDTVIGPRADGVSGGQQQRICLARALAARPQILILDEPTSAVDPHSESAILSALAQLKHELTIFIVAHRMSTAEICDRIMVIVDGRLESFGTVDSLRDASPYYQSIFDLNVRGMTKRP